MDLDVIQFILKPCYLLLAVKTHQTCGHGHTAKYLSKSPLRKALIISEHEGEIIVRYTKFFKTFSLSRNMATNLWKTRKSTG